MRIQKAAEFFPGKAEMSQLRIRINAHRPAGRTQDTILHELIHYFLSCNQVEDASAHGPLFRSGSWTTSTENSGEIFTMSRQSTKERGGNSLQDQRIRHHVVARRQFDGRTGIKVLPVSERASSVITTR